jgi:hypothetical protein
MSESMLDAAERGCPSGLGFGKGRANSTCAGSGGAHGGKGGSGLSYSVEHKSCKENLNIYFYEDEARFEGSAGGCGRVDPTLGGNGGGVIWISATDTVNISDSTITVQG